MGGNDDMATWGRLLDAVDRGVLCSADAERLLTAACDLAGADTIAIQRHGENGWRHVVERGSTKSEGGPPTAERRHSAYGHWTLEGGSGDLPWTRATTTLRSIDGPVHVAFAATPRSGGSHPTKLRMVGAQLEAMLQSPRALAALRGDLGTDRNDALARIPHGAIVGQSVQLNEAALDLLRDVLGNLAGRSVQRLQRAMLHASGSAAGQSVPFVGDLRIDFVKTDEGMLALLRRAHVPTLHGHWTAPAENMLSPRQRQVAQLVMQGKNLAGIAESLEVQAETARGYLKDVYRRLGVRDRGSLMAILRF